MTVWTWEKWLLFYILAWLHLPCALPHLLRSTFWSHFWYLFLLIMVLVLSAAVPARLPVPAALWDFLLDTCGEHLPYSFLTVHTLKKGRGCLWLPAGARLNMVPVASALRGEAVQTSSRSRTQPEYFIVFCCKTWSSEWQRLAIILSYVLLLEGCWLPSELDV